MPRAKKQDTQTHSHLHFSNFMASKSGLGLLIAANILPYILILSVSGIMEEDSQKLAKPMGTIISLTFLFEVWKASFIYDKKFLNTLGHSLIFALFISKYAVEYALKPAFIVNNFFKEKVKEKTAQPARLTRPE